MTEPLLKLDIDELFDSVHKILGGVVFFVHTLS